MRINDGFWLYKVKINEIFADYEFSSHIEWIAAPNLDTALAAARKYFEDLDDIDGPRVEGVWEEGSIIVAYDEKGLDRLEPESEEENDDSNQ